MISIDFLSVAMFSSLVTGWATSIDTKKSIKESFRCWPSFIRTSVSCRFPSFSDWNPLEPLTLDIQRSSKFRSASVWMVSVSGPTSHWLCHALGAFIQSLSNPACILRTCLNTSLESICRSFPAYRHIRHGDSRPTNLTIHIDQSSQRN